MHKHRFVASTIVGLIVGGLIAITLSLSVYKNTAYTPDTPLRLKTSQASGSSEFGINGGVSSISSKQTAINEIVSGGYGWMRNEFTYSASIDFTPYDAANSLAKTAGIKTLGLLMYPGTDHQAWKDYVAAVVGRYGTDIAAWEIMNEADNYLTPAEYVVYLGEANTIIKGINSNAVIVASGVTSRSQATNFWDGINAAGGWGLFDIIGLHVYHTGNPEQVNFGGGDLVGELSRVVGDINKNGGGKSIWITEMGYQSSVVGAANQANWLARSLVMLRSVPQLQRIFLYHLYDGGSDTYGLLTSSLVEKQSFGTLKGVIGHLAGAGTGTKLIPQQNTSLDDFTNFGGWDTKQNSNATANISATAGYAGQGMQIDYTFSAASAYALIHKNIPIPGNPTALASWINGDNTGNVWKFRFKDAKGETFQMDLGSIASGWSYKQFTFATDSGMTSFGGDGTIDYPIAFDSFVIDHQSGSNSGSGKVDELIAISGSADLYAYQFGSNVGWWKGTGTTTAALCGATRTFSEDVQFAGITSCSGTPAAASPTSNTPAAPKKAAPPIAPKAPAAPIIPADKTKSTVRLDGANIVADDIATYAVVVDVKDSTGKAIIDQKPSILLGGGQTTLHDEILIGGEWIAHISSHDPGQRTADVQVGTVDLGSVTMTFVTAAAPVTPIAVLPVEQNASPVPLLPEAPLPLDSRTLLAGGGTVLLMMVLGVLIKLRFFPKHPPA